MHPPRQNSMSDPILTTRRSYKCGMTDKIPFQKEEAPWRAACHRSHERATIASIHHRAPSIKAKIKCKQKKFLDNTFSLCLFTFLAHSRFWRLWICLQNMIDHERTERYICSEKRNPKQSFSHTESEMFKPMICIYIYV